MIIFYNIINWFFLIGYWLLIVIITFRIIIKCHTAPSSIAWLLIIYIIPLLGVITYLLFGELNLGKHRTKHSKLLWILTKKWIKKLKKYKKIFSNKNSITAQSIFKLCKQRQGIDGFKGNKIKLLTNSNKVLQTLIKDINLAKNDIKIVFYIWQEGGLVNHVIEALISAAKRGVQCRLILDSAGSINFFRSIYPNLMRTAGIYIVEALNVNLLCIFLRRMDLRQHRKIIIIDNYIVYTGSMNMVDPLYFKKYIQVGQWIDIMVKIKGPIAIAISIIFSCDWEIETGERIFPLISNINTTLYKKCNNHIIQVIASGPGFPEGMIHQALLTSIYSANKRLIITTPYLVPSDDILYAICTAAQRNVKVHIIIPYYNDSILVDWASRTFFSKLLKSGVLIHKFKEGLLHTKSILVDNQLSLIGTVNLDIRSLWLNLEITLVIDDNNFAKNLLQIQKYYISHSSLVNFEIWSKRPYWQRIIERLFYFLSPLL